MIQENNKKDFLRFLLKNKHITYYEYLFRLKASELNIKTYKLNVK